MAECIPLGGNKWRIRQFCKRENGKKVYCYDKTLVFGNIKDRNSHRRKIESSHEDGTLHEDSANALTLDRHLDDWLKHKRPHLEPNTYIDYEETLGRYARSFKGEGQSVEMGKRPLTSIKPYDLQELYNSMIARGLSARSVQSLHAVLNQALERAVWWERIPSNPARRTERPQVKREKPNPLQPDEAPKFLEAARSDRLGALFTLMILNGPRPEECFGLSWEHVDLERGQVRIKRVLKWNRKGGGWRIREYPKTSAGARVLKLERRMIETLQEHRRTQLAERLASGKRYTNHSLVFSTATGEPLLLTNVIRRHLRPILKAAGVRQVKLYDLRHTYATLSIAAGEDAKYVSTQLGHESVAFTLDVYVQIVESMHASGSGKLESLLYPDAGEEKRQVVGGGS